MSEYIKESSNYFIRKNPTPTKNGYIYENDMLTTIRNFNTLNNGMLTSTEGGFTFLENITSDDNKIYNVSGWSNNVYTLSDVNITDNDIKKLNNSTDSLPKQKYVNLNNVYDGLSKYCYFGSSNAMLKASIDEIILKFPAALALTSIDGLIVNGNLLTFDITYLNNPFFIDFNDYTYDRMNLSYDIRNIASSFLDYEISLNDKTTIGDVIGYTGTTNDNQSYITFLLSENNSTIVNGDILYIRPNKAKQEQFYNELDEFQRILLNRYSVPKYRSNFKIPKEDSNGINYEYKTFIWSTSDGYNIDTQTSSYALFVQDLIDATNLIDELFCDNLYRMLTHDSIKNLDSAYSQTIDQDVIDDIIVGGSKIQKIIRLYGKSFDELKKYIDGISLTNNITFKGINNLPEEYLSGKLDSSGWDVFSLTNFIDSDTVTIPNIFPGSVKSDTLIEVNNQLIRNLIINSPYIFKSKGTRKSIRKILGLLGLDQSWYEINEYVQLVNTYLSGDTLKNISNLNYYIYPENYGVYDGREPYQYMFDQSIFDNTNIECVIKCPICNSEEYYISGYDSSASGTCENNHTFLLTDAMIGFPKLWVSPDSYFQGNGGWYRETGGLHLGFTGGTNYVEDIVYGNNPHIGNGEYDNGFDYIDQFSNIFKRFIRTAPISTIPPLSGFTNLGFDLKNNKKVVNNKKINYNKINTGATNYNNDDRLILNLKNFNINIYGDKVLQSFFNGNSNTNIINSSGGTKNILSSNGDYQQIINVTGATTALILNNNIENGKRIKLYNSLLGDGSSITISGDSNVIIEPGLSIYYGKIILIEKDNGIVNVKSYDGIDEYNILKSITLPYLEQLVPSTSIFNFNLINKMPEWRLVDEYCERDTYGNFTGRKILGYQNINNYDDNTPSIYNSGLTQYSILNDIILEEFGPGYSYLNSVDKNKFTYNEENKIYENTGENNGFDNIYYFAGISSSCPISSSPNWVVDKTLI